MCPLSGQETDMPEGVSSVASPKKPFVIGIKRDESIDGYSAAESTRSRECRPFDVDGCIAVRASRYGRCASPSEGAPSRGHTYALESQTGTSINPKWLRASTTTTTRATTTTTRRTFDLRAHHQGGVVSRLIVFARLPRPNYGSLGWTDPDSTDRRF